MSAVSRVAQIVVGSGSASFEMVRSLVERLSAMVTLRWVRVEAQPIAIEDVVAYLVAALDHEPEGGELYEIGGADRVTYLDLMREYGRRRGLRRVMIPVPVLTPRLSSLWLWLVTLVYAGVGRKLVDSLRNETVVRDSRALEVFPVKPRTARDDTLDFWRVDAYEPHHLLRLRAEMRVPGRAWLQFEVQPCDDVSSRVTQTAIFEPVGVLGLLYWYCLWPFHHVIFGGMLRNLALAMNSAADRAAPD